MLVLEAERKRWASGKEFDWLRPVPSHLIGVSFASLGLHGTCQRDELEHYPSAGLADCLNGRTVGHWMGRLHAMAAFSPVHIFNQQSAWAVSSCKLLESHHLAV